MKKLILLLSMTYVSFVVNAQTLYVPSGTGGIGSSSNSNVGIGTASPSTTLQVNGDFSVGDEAVIEPGLNIASTNGVEKTYVRYGQQHPNRNMAFTMFGDDNTDRYSFMTDYGSTGTYTERMVIMAQTGNVGIGTTTPATMLQVNGDFSVGDEAVIEPGLSIAPTNGVEKTYLRYGQQHPNRNMAFTMFGDDGTDHYSFMTDYGSTGTYTERMVIMAQTGNVGIGTTTPATTLQVNGDFSVGDEAVIEPGLNIAPTNGVEKTYVRYGQQHPNRNMAFTMFGDDGTDHYSFMTDYGSTGTYTERMVIMAQTGNVGIGTTSPNAKLAVDGDVRATEINVMF